MKCYFDPAQLRHRPLTYFSRGAMRTPEEVPERIQPILDAMAACQVPVETPTDHGIADILAVHDFGYLNFLRTAHARWPKDWGPEVISNIFVRTPNSKKGVLAEAAAYLADGSAPVGENTWTAAYASAQSALSAADDILNGERLAYALCRPTGHHARRAAAGGFCYLNNPAIAAQALRRKFGRVTIFDPDMHHGQGVQEIFWERSDVQYVSVHGDPTNFYPAVAGFEEERGAGEGFGFNRNYPMPHGSSQAYFLDTIDRALSAIRLYDPEVIVLALGFDTYKDDPQSKTNVDTDAFEILGQKVAALGKPLCITQEGGYDIAHLQVNATRFFKGLLGA